MTRKNILFGIAVVVLVVVFVSQWSTRDDSREIITQLDVSIDDDLRVFLEDELGVWQAAIAAHAEVGTQPDLNLYINAALIAKHLGDLGYAKEAYEQYFEYNSINQDVYSNYGNLLRQMGDYLGAEAAYRMAISLDDDSENYYLNLARLYDEMGRTDDILGVYEEAVEKAGRTRPLMVLIAEWYEEDGNCERAINHYELAVEFSEDEGIAAIVQEDLDELEASCK
jgi:tetratricopeptide (TPR) repeat protein